MTDTKTDTKFLVSDLANARRLVEMHGEQFRYAPELHQWLTWDSRRWANDTTGEIDRWAKGVALALADEAHLLGDYVLFKHAIKSQNTAGIANMIQSASTELGISVQAKELDCDPWSFNVRNGTLDLRTGKTHDHRQSDLLTKISDVIYDPDAQCPLWLSTLDGIFAGDQLLVTCLQRFVGYSLTGIVSEHVMTFSYGDGANGKTTVMNALQSIMGDYGISLAADVLIDSGHETHTTGLTDLRGARFVVATETAAGRKFDEALLKKLTGGDPITARRMRTDNFTWIPTHKIFMHGNYLPRVQGTDWGFWRRLKILPFKVQFALDPTLEDRLLKEASGILTWAVQGCLAWQLDGLQWPAPVEEATQSYRQSQDQVGRFIDDECKVDERFYVTTKALYVAYENWGHENGERTGTATALGKELTRRRIDSKHTNKGKVWLGLGLAADEMLQ